MKLNILYIILFVSLFTLPAAAQSKTNLEIINDLLEKSVSSADVLLDHKNPILLNVETPQPLEILKPAVYTAFNKKGYVLTTNAETAAKSLNFTLISANVEYKDSFADGIFGGTLLTREIKVTGSVLTKGDDNTLHSSQFVETNLDTIKLGDISTLENQALPFTHSELPSLPLLSNLWEPIIVIGTLTVTVILLFTVRSK